MPTGDDCLTLQLHGHLDDVTLRVPSGHATPRLNAAPSLEPSLEPEPGLLRELAEHYRPHNERLFELIGRDLGWHSDPKYWYYQPPASPRASGEAGD